MPEIPPEGFLGLPEELRDPGRARVFVLPIPYEATVSYGTGTREGPAAIIAASQQVELYDPDSGREPALSFGIHTRPALPSDFPTPDAMVEGIAEAVEPIAKAGKLLLALGGEHSISAGIVRGLRRVHKEPLTVVQIDAHADLRDSYQGTRFSHACAMRRVLEENPGPIVSLGIRSYSLEEAEFLRDNPGRITPWPAERIHREEQRVFLQRLRESLAGRRLYVTIDVDGLDPSVVPATGTPEPGGLSWVQTRDLLRAVAAAGEVIAVDCVELSPRQGLHMAEFAIARLLADFLGRVMAEKRSAGASKI